MSDYTKIIAASGIRSCVLISFTLYSYLAQILYLLWAAFVFDRLHHYHNYAFHPEFTDDYTKRSLLRNTNLCIANNSKIKSCSKSALNYISRLVGFSETNSWCGWKRLGWVPMFVHLWHLSLKPQKKQIPRSSFCCSIISTCFAIKFNTEAESVVEIW